MQDASGRLAYANDAAARLLGFDTREALVLASTEEIMSRFDVLDEHGAPLDLARLPGRRVLAGETPEPLLIQYVVRASGDRRFTVTKASPLHDDDGRVLFAINIVEDVTELMRAEHEQRLLAEAGKTLSATLDPRLTVDRLAWTLVPGVARWASVHVPDARGRLTVAAVAPPDAQPEHDAGTVESVLRTGRPEARDDVLTVPLVARDRVLGALRCAAAAGRFDERDLAMAEELGRRAGTALDNARQHESRARIATTLQRSLLPPRLPEVPGLIMAARFRSAEEGTDVGGDFYDVFPVDGGWMAVMGDVTGKGPAAAAVTGLARATLRTAALYEPEPGAMLERLNTTLLGEQRQCSAVCARLTPAGDAWTVTLACAGHPAPFLLRRGEEPQPLRTRGTLGGAFATGTWSDRTASLQPGDRLLFFTDGVPDTLGAEGRFEYERLVALLAQLDGEGADALAARVDEALRAFQDGRAQRDDVALLALEVEG